MKIEWIKQTKNKKSKFEVKIRFHDDFQELLGFLLDTLLIFLSRFLKNWLLRLKWMWADLFQFLLDSLSNLEAFSKYLILFEMAIKTTFRLIKELFL